MRYNQLFGQTIRQAPKDEATANARLLVQAGYVDKLMAGVYSYLPLGLRTLDNIAAIVREEMDAIGGQEVQLPMLHPKANWAATGAWDGIDVLFHVPSRTGREYALGQSEEEVAAPLALARVQTVADLPLAIYQVGWKFRDELRAKSGLMRGREFLMADMYSFHQDQADFDRFYAIVKAAYLRVYRRLGLTAKVTEASGGAFSEKISYEFMVLTEAGEDDILYCPACDWCVNVEIATVAAGDACPARGDGTLRAARASEVGNVFDLGEKYSRAFDRPVRAADGGRVYPIMGCFGLGISRVMGVMAEVFHDDRGLVWPESVAPARVHLATLGSDLTVAVAGEDVHRQLAAAIGPRQVLWDDRPVSAGVKLADADLIGLPFRVIISARTLADGEAEIKPRGSDQTARVPVDALVAALPRWPSSRSGRVETP
jgi:prolyl-tRNA synthetase